MEQHPQHLQHPQQPRLPVSYGHSPATGAAAALSRGPDGAISRRRVLEGTLLLGGAALLVGCQASPRGVASLPPDVWPDARPPSPIPGPTPLPPGSGGGLPEGVIARTQWTSAKPDLRYKKPMNGVQRITIHHSALNSTNLLSKDSVARQLEGIRRTHTARTDGANGSHWIDIGYHYIIDPAGRIWEGRPVAIEGAHVSDTNPHNLGIMLMGNFSQHRPTAAALGSLDNFVASQMRRYRVPIRSVYTHQELKPTECPGTYLQQYMRTTRTASGRMARTAMA